MSTRGLYNIRIILYTYMAPMHPMHVVLKIVHDGSNFYCELRPDQINCLFHGSGGSIFLAFENINWIGVVLPATQ